MYVFEPSLGRISFDEPEQREKQHPCLSQSQAKEPYAAGEGHPEASGHKVFHPVEECVLLAAQSFVQPEVAV